MDKAFLNEVIVSTYEISLDYELEKVVRAHSRNKRISCVDPHFKNPVLRYCHGDKKEAYFAHLANTDCDYCRFDKNDTPPFRELRIKLFHHFSSLGYKVETEYKLLERHYSPVFCSKENESFVIEMGDSKTTMGYVERILQEYSSKRMPVKWLVVGEQNLLLKENGVSFLKRFLLNESKNNDFILVDGNEIIQYRLDKKNYPLSDYQEIYFEKADFQDLCVVDGGLSIKGFDSKFALWQNQKEITISQELARRQALREEQERQAIIRRQAEQERLAAIRKQTEQERLAQSTTHQKTQTAITEKHIPDAPRVTYGTRIYTCTGCGKKAGNDEFYMTQGNTGTCWECLYGPEKYKEIKKHRGY